MYIYSVTIKLDISIEKEWLEWMRGEHIAEVLATGMFQRYSFKQLLDPIDEDEPSKTYIIQYYTDTLDKYHTYINEYAPALRQKGLDRFKDRFIGFRTLLLEIENG